MKFKFFKLFLSINLVMAVVGYTDNIRILKQNIWHEFVSFDNATDHFTRNVFPHWEPETFQVFDTVKDPNGIAIDLGAWIGTTAIWLSKNFAHVIAVEADVVSLDCLRNNLAASKCFNVAICSNAIAEKAGSMIFGPRGRQALNDSMSCIKTEQYHKDDYIVKTATLKQIVEENLANINLNSKRISFIKCDIEGGEELVLEDILAFALENRCNAYISFHLDWWNSKKINEFENLFNRFQTNCPETDICEYIKKNPFASVLFTPKGVL